MTKTLSIILIGIVIFVSIIYLTEYVIHQRMLEAIKKINNEKVIIMEIQI